MGRRLRLNAARVGEPLYCAPNVPPRGVRRHGDFEGRTLLALVSLWKATEPNLLCAHCGRADGQ
ncbi:MAG: hypothetical protein ACLRTQ_01670 [Candidatus Borkfalkia sp.]